jgi:acyl-CoA thioester hydrolase
MSNYVETFRGVIYPWHCDHQGHLTAMHYLGLFDQAFWHLYSTMGFTRSQMEAGHRGFVTVKDTIEYRAEQSAGATLIIKSGLTKIGNSSAVSYSVMENSETGDVAATWENVSVYFDLAERTKTALTAAEKQRMEKHLVEPI